jgi:hypothetical protein
MMAAVNLRGAARVLSSVNKAVVTRLPNSLVSLHPGYEQFKADKAGQKALP